MSQAYAKSFKYISSSLNPMIRYYYHLHLTDEAEAWRGSRSGRYRWKRQDPGTVASACALTDSVHSDGPLKSFYFSPSEVILEPSSHIPSYHNHPHHLHLTCENTEIQRGNTMLEADGEPDLNGVCIQSYVLSSVPALQTWSFRCEHQTRSEMWENSLSSADQPGRDGVHWVRWLPRIQLTGDRAISYMDATRPGLFQMYHRERGTFRSTQARHCAISSESPIGEKEMWVVRGDEHWVLAC